MKIPDFFIVGAPKCGTTALSEYLRGHPQIFLSNPKEPHFFNTDHANRPTESLHDYLRLFHRALPDQHVAGEASTRYLVSQSAVVNILKLNPDAKFIVMVRNPIDMAHALHAQSVGDATENVLDFEQAWRLQDMRRIGKHVPLTCPDKAHLLYGDICKVGVQLERLMGRVTASRLNVIVFDDFVANTQGVYEDTLRFLGVQPDGRSEFPAYNQNRSVRALHLQRMLLTLGALKIRLGVRRGLGIYKMMQKMTTRRACRENLPARFREELVEYFRDDVRLLSELLHRDLTSWLG